MVGWLLGRALEGLNYVGRCGQVRVAHSQVDDVCAPGALLVSHPVDLGKEVRRQGRQAVGLGYFERCH